MRRTTDCINQIFGSGCFVLLLLPFTIYLVPIFVVIDFIELIARSQGRSYIKGFLYKFDVKECSACFSKKYEIYNCSTNIRLIFCECLSCGAKRRFKLAQGASLNHYQSNAVRNYFYHNNKIIHFFEAGKKKSRSRDISPGVRREVFRRDKGVCVRCGSKHDIHYDHILPFSKGGGNDANNIQILCRTCNLRKGSKIDG